MSTGSKVCRGKRLLSLLYNKNSRLKILNLKLCNNFQYREVPTLLTGYVPKVCSKLRSLFPIVPMI
jgi:hypothetical protein